jgi:HPt (histidine-containing phosphotransfer) domain-containing protein
MAAGMNHFLSKPFEVETMVSTLLNLTGHTDHVKETPMNTMPPTRARVGVPRPAMDVERALAIWKDAEVYRKFLRKFARDYGPCVGEMRASASAAAKARAHKLRGAAGSLVLDGIAHAAQVLEHCLGSASNPQAAYATLQQELDVALAQIQAYAGAEPQLAPSAQGPAVPHLAPTERDRLRQLLQRALQRLDDDTPAAVEPVLAELADVLPHAALAPLRSALENYAFDAGKRAVHTLATQHQLQLET